MSGTAARITRMRPVSAATPGQSARTARLLLAGALLFLFGWSYWPTLASLWRVWGNNEDYSAGRLVPLVAAYLVWARRRQLATTPMSTCWWGLAVLLFSQVVRLGAVLLSYGSFEQYSLVLAVAGTTLLLLGWPMTRRLMWVLLFLLLLVPFPRRVHALIALPLQRFATVSAVFCLETLGYLVTRQGNVLVLGENSSLAVAEACSGLRMLTAFIIVGATMAFLVGRPLWQKALLVASTLPVAVLINTLRITATAVVSERYGAQASEDFFHDYAGLMMMPLAFGVLIALLRLMGPPSAMPAAPAAGNHKRGRAHAI